MFYLVGKNKNYELSYEGPGTIWEFVGLFDDEEKAKEACIAWNFFVGPISALNQALPDETKTWPGCYYPTN